METENLKMYKITIKDGRMSDSSFYDAVQEEIKHLSEELDYPAAGLCTRDGKTASIELITTAEQLPQYLKDRFEGLYHVENFTMELQSMSNDIIQMKLKAWQFAKRTPLYQMQQIQHKKL